MKPITATTNRVRASLVRLNHYCDEPFEDGEDPRWPKDFPRQDLYLILSVMDFLLEKHEYQNGIEI